MPFSEHQLCASFQVQDCWTSTAPLCGGSWRQTKTLGGAASSGDPGGRSRSAWLQSGFGPPGHSPLVSHTGQTHGEGDGRQGKKYLTSWGVKLGEMALFEYFHAWIQNYKRGLPSRMIFSGRSCDGTTRCSYSEVDITASRGKTWTSQN